MPYGRSYEEEFLKLYGSSAILAHRVEGSVDEWNEPTVTWDEVDVDVWWSHARLTDGIIVDEGYSIKDYRWYTIPPDFDGYVVKGDLIVDEDVRFEILDVYTFKDKDVARHITCLTRRVKE